LEEAGIIKKNKKEGNQKSNIYTLTQMGLGLLPIIAEITLWSDENVRKLNPTMVKEDYHDLRTNKKVFLKGIEQAYLKSTASENDN
jgi:DNA-binding HxlR family transcriptional regulator